MKKLLYIIIAVFWGTSTNAIKLVNELDSEVTFTVHIKRKAEYFYSEDNSIKLDAETSLEWQIEEWIQYLNKMGEDVHFVKIDAAYYLRFGECSHALRTIECKEMIKYPYDDRYFRFKYVIFEFMNCIYNNKTFTKELERLKNQTVRIEKSLKNDEFYSCPLLIPYIILEQ